MRRSLPVASDQHGRHRVVNPAPSSPDAACARWPWRLCGKCFVAEADPGLGLVTVHAPDIFAYHRSHICNSAKDRHRVLITSHLPPAYSSDPQPVASSLFVESLRSENPRRCLGRQAKLCRGKSRRKVTGLPGRWNLAFVLMEVGWFWGAAWCNCRHEQAMGSYRIPLTTGVFNATHLGITSRETFRCSPSGACCCRAPPA